MAYGVKVRRAIFFPIIKGVLYALFEHDQVAFDEAAHVLENSSIRSVSSEEIFTGHNVTQAKNESR